MSASRQIRAEAVVVLGFALSAVAGVLAYIYDVTSISYQFNSFQDVLDPLIPPLTSIASVIAWLWLTQLDPRDEGQRRILRRAYLFFAIQYVLLSAGYNFIFTPIRSFGGFWITTYLWIFFVGAVVTAFGLFRVSRILSRVSFDGVDIETEVAS